MNTVLVLFGPTASGKTSLLETLFVGRRAEFGLPEAEIVSADSMQVYRGMDVGTAKPDAAFRERLPHHLVDVRDPSEQFTAGDFVALADAACADILARGRLPVVAGGTAFYLRNFVCGLPATPKADPASRARVAADLAERGLSVLFEELRRADPVAASRIAPNDAYRVTRALEVVRATGKPLSDFAVPSKPRALWHFALMCAERPRAELYARIDGRVDAMFAAGLPAEVRSLVARGYGPGDPGMKAIGYGEFFAPDGSLRPDSRELRDEIKLDTRRYAKRQLSFFRSLEGLVSLDPSDVEGSAAAVKSAIAFR